jgi:AbrB family looped-hinge helix DNA binding protein
MEYILKVSPKGQVTLPKRLRTRLAIQDLLEIEVKEDQGILKRSEPATDRMAGCFNKYFLVKKTGLKEALKQASEIVSHEIASKNN